MNKRRLNVYNWFCASLKWQTHFLCFLLSQTNHKKHSDVCPLWVHHSILPFEQGGQSSFSHTTAAQRWSFFSAQRSRWCKHGAGTHVLSGCSALWCCMYGLWLIYKDHMQVSGGYIGGYCSRVHTFCEWVPPHKLFFPAQFLFRCGPPDTHHQLCNSPCSAASLINGLCQRQCQSIGCSFWVCLGVGEELCILRRSAQWLAKSWLYWFLSSLLFVKTSNYRP